MSVIFKSDYVRRKCFVISIDICGHENFKLKKNENFLLLSVEMEQYRFRRFIYRSIRQHCWESRNFLACKITSATTYCPVISKYTVFDAKNSSTTIVDHQFVKYEIDK